MRRVLAIASIVLPVIVLTFWAMAGSGIQAHQAGGAWEYGSLEIVQTGRGTAYVFCQYTAEGRTETQLDVRPMTTPQFPPMSAELPHSNTDAAFARAMARLGRDGWELVHETRFARFGDGEPVLMFKRPAR